MAALENSETEPFELRPEPTPILTIPPDDPEPEYTDEQLEYKRKKEKAQRCKVIAMDVLDLDPLKNTYYSSKAEKLLILKEVEKWFEKTDEEVKAKFYDVVNARVLNFDDPKTDYSNFPVYKTTIPT
jgi:hypothetical protein